MPKFFFHIRDGETLEVDPEGVEFPTLERAVLDAQAAAREMLAERLLAGERLNGQRLEIADETGTILQVVTFKSVLNFH